MKNVYITIGLPSCGKSTWIKNNLNGLDPVVLDADIICEEVNGNALNRSNFDEVARIHYNRYVEYLKDPNVNYLAITNTSLSKQKRTQYWLLAEYAGVKCNFTFVYFDRSAKECIEMQQQRERKVPENVIYDMEKVICMPDVKELRAFGTNSKIIYIK